MHAMSTVAPVPASPSPTTGASPHSLATSHGTPISRAMLCPMHTTGGASSASGGGVLYSGERVDAGPSNATTMNTDTSATTTTTALPPVHDPWSFYPTISETILSYLSLRDLLAMRRVSPNFRALTDQRLAAHLVISADNAPGVTVVSGYTGRGVGAPVSPAWSFDAASARAMRSCRWLDIHRPVEDHRLYLFRISDGQKLPRGLPSGYIYCDDDGDTARLRLHQDRTNYPFEQLDHVDMADYAECFTNLRAVRVVIDAAYPVFTVPRHVPTPPRLIVFTPTGRAEDGVWPSLWIPTVVPPPGVARLTLNVRYFVDMPWPRREVRQEPLFIPPSLREVVLIFSPLDHVLSLPRPPAPKADSTDDEWSLSEEQDPHAGHQFPEPVFIVALLAAIVRHNLTSRQRVECTVVGMDWANDALWSDVPDDVDAWAVDAVVRQLRKEDRGRRPRPVSAQDLWGDRPGTPKQASMLQVHQANVAKATALAVHKHSGRFFRDLAGNIPARFRSPSPPPRGLPLDEEVVRAEADKVTFVSRRVYRAGVGWETYDFETKVDRSGVPVSAGSGV